MSMVFTDAHVTINGTTDDISEFVKSVTIEGSRSEHDNTTMGAGGKTRVVGMTDGSVSLELVDNFESGEIDDILWSIFEAGENVEMRVRASSASVGSDNPEFRFKVAPTGYTFGGSVDELAQKSISWPISGPITRATS